MFPSIMLYSVILVCPLLLLYNTPNVSGSTEPLFLTPYLQQGDITTARELSFVDDEDSVIPRSHAGYITVDEDVGNHLFFWFFPTLNSNSSAPLLIWLNGGPGESSMIGLLLENGPIQLGKSNSGETIYTSRKNSWVNKFSMLYIDNPVGVGYSYSELLYEGGGRGDQIGISSDLYEFLKQFYQIFPDFQQRDLYIGGQSYGGKYVPFFAQRVHEEIQKGRFEIPLKGIYIGGPLFDPAIQGSELFDLYYNLGYIKRSELIKFKRNWREKLPVLEGEELYMFRDLMFESSDGNFHTHENLHFDDIASVMTSDKLRSLLHVGNGTFQSYNDDIGYYVITKDFRNSSASQLAVVMNNYKVLIFGGDLDGLVSSPGIESILMSLPWSSQAAYNDSVREEWIEVNEEGQKRLKGFYTRVSSFCRVVIKASGHRTGINQPENTLEMMEKFVASGCLD